MKRTAWQQLSLYYMIVSTIFLLGHYGIYLGRGDAYKNVAYIKIPQHLDRYEAVKGDVLQIPLIYLQAHTAIVDLQTILFVFLGLALLIGIWNLIRHARKQRI